MATGFEQMMAGLSSLAGSMKEFAQTRAVSHAQDELNQLNSMEMEESKKRQQQQMISQNLAMNLSKTGGDLRTAAMLAPTPFENTESWVKQVHKDDMSNKAADRAVHLQVARIGAEGKADRRDAQVSKLMLDQIKEFNNREDIKQLRTSLGSMSKFDTLLQDGSATGFNLSKLALIKMAQGTGVVTEEDAKKAEGSPDYASQVMRAISLKTTGTPLKEDRDTFQRIAGALTSKAQERLLRKAKAFSSSKGPYIPGQNAESFHQALVRGVQDEMTSEDNGTPEATAPEGRTPQVPVGRPQTQEPQAAPQSRMMQFIKK